MTHSEKIEIDEAKRSYQVVCDHARMVENGELRFRLKKLTDGTAYIRTEASSAGWQQCHYHQYVQETYIVQKGWIAYAECIENDPPFLVIYNEGELFTTRPGRNSKNSESG